MSAQKALPLTKEEVMMLVELIQTHPVLFSKATNATNNQLKDATWVKLTASFNSMIASNPRKPEQLRLKWENLKKAARKRSTKIRMNNLKTGGGKPDYIPPDEALDKVASILGATCDGYSVPFGGDAEMEVAVDTMVEAEKSVEEQIIVVPFDDDIDPLPPTPAQPALSPLHTPPSHKKFFFSSAQSKGKLKRQTAACDAKASVIARNRAIAEYYEAKKKQEEIIATLKKRKLELEIMELERKICPDPWDTNSGSSDKNND